jgi:hypothetical protein
MGEIMNAYRFWPEDVMEGDTNSEESNIKRVLKNQDATVWVGLS